jgi:hypothetical protein
MSEITLRLDDQTVARLEEEIKRKRAAGQSNGLSEVFLIRLLDSLSNKKPVLSLSFQKSKLVIRDYKSLNINGKLPENMLDKS